LPNRVQAENQHLSCRKFNSRSLVAGFRRILADPQRGRRAVTLTPREFACWSSSSAVRGQGYRLAADGG
jgi:hypothetical protein